MEPTPTLFYTNAMELALSAYDVTLRFLRNGSDNSAAAGPGPTESKVVVLDSLIVSMSPSHLKAMMPALIIAIVEYEKMFGSIPLPPDQAEAWKNIKFGEKQ